MCQAYPLIVEPAISFKTHYINVILLQLGRHEDALEFAVASHSLAPSKSEVAERVANVKRDIALGMDNMAFMPGFSYKDVYIELLHFYFYMYVQIRQ